MGPRAPLTDPDDPQHGTVSGYTNHGCRCPRCSDYWSAYQRAKYQSKGWPQLIEYTPVTLPAEFRWPPYGYPAAILRPAHDGTAVDSHQGRRAAIEFHVRYLEIWTVAPLPRCRTGLHVMTPANTRRTGDGKHVCRACLAAEKAAYAARKVGAA